MNRRSRRTALALIASIVLVIPVAALAGSVFNDVDDSNIFISDITWLKDAEVTKGCNPPANTDFCPEDDVTRQEMAAFLHRLAINRVVDADTVDGKDAVDIMSTTASASATGVAVTTAPKLITSITGFEVPNGGGVITAHANVTAELVSTDQLGLIWAEIDGDGSCSVPGAPGNVAWFYLPSPLIVDSAHAVSTSAVPAGSIDIDLCVGGAGTIDTIISGQVSATWTPDENGASVAGSSAGMTWAEFTALYPDIFGQ